MRRLISRAIASAMLLSLAPAGASALLAAGEEFQVSTYTGVSASKVVAALPSTGS